MHPKIERLPPSRTAVGSLALTGLPPAGQGGCVHSWRPHFPSPGSLLMPAGCLASSVFCGPKPSINWVQVPGSASLWGTVCPHTALTLQGSRPGCAGCPHSPGL